MIPLSGYYISTYSNGQRPTFLEHLGSTPDSIAEFYLLTNANELFLLFKFILKLFQVTIKIISHSYINMKILTFSPMDAFDFFHYYMKIKAQALRNQVFRS